jgi:hypothetical protein
MTANGTLFLFQNFCTVMFNRDSEGEVPVCALLRVLSPAGVNDRVTITRNHDGSVQEENKCLTPRSIVDPA